MKTPLLLAVTALSLAVSAQELPGWKLVWADEFNTGTVPNPQYWGYETGLVRNYEAQLYTNRKENARIENGCLILEGRHEEIRNPRYQKDSKDWNKVEFAHYSSASLSTYQRIHWLYGRIEVRAKIPAGTGTWPAIWMMGGNNSFERWTTSMPAPDALPVVWQAAQSAQKKQVSDQGWPGCGEIDIMEHVGKAPLAIHGTCHWRDTSDKKHRGKGGHFDNAKADDTYSDFHIYAIEWDADTIKFFYDSHLYFTYDVSLANQTDGSNPFRLPQYLKLNLALGGSWGGPAIDDTKMPAQFLIDYVRVYQKP